MERQLIFLVPKQHWIPYGTGRLIGIQTRIRYSGLSGAALPETIAVAVHLEDVDVVGQPVEQRAGQTLGAEDLGPFVEGQVAGDQGGAAFVALRDQLEQQLGAGLGEGHEAQLVDDQELQAAICFCKRSRRRSSRASIISLTSAAAVVNPTDKALLAGGQAQTQRNMGLARAAGPERDDILAPLDPFARGPVPAPASC
jgi:hypothetical protein